MTDNSNVTHVDASGTYTASFMVYGSNGCHYCVSSEPIAIELDAIATSLDIQEITTGDCFTMPE